ncbi:MAG: lipid A deacylase LpxR family protein [Nitrospinota bacterium]|nr:lipid A deacylase LpxR family protein [Nitrospinota bacterium]
MARSLGFVMAISLLWAFCAPQAAKARHWELAPLDYIYHGKYELALFEENDALVPWKGTDESYTNGSRLQLRMIGRAHATDTDGNALELIHDTAGNWLVESKNKLIYLGGWPDIGMARALNGASAISLKKDSRSGQWYLPVWRTNFVMVIGQNIYTPSDKSHLEPQTEGRPYAGWLYAGFFKETLTTEDLYYRYGLQLGCVGPCAFAEKTQTWVHRNIVSSPVPQGWSNQIKDEFGVVLSGELRKTVLDLPTAGGLNSRYFDLALYSDGNVGNIFTDLSAGAIIRLGWFASYFYGQGESPVAAPKRAAENDQILALMAQEGVYPMTSDFGRILPAGHEYYLFFRAESRAVIHNALLQGGQYGENDPYTVTPYRFVMEGELGLAYRRGPYSAQYAIGFISSEFNAERWRALRNIYGKLHLGFCF